LLSLQDHSLYINPISNDNFFDLQISYTEEFCSASPCPTLLYAGGEGDIGDFVDNTVFVWDLAETLKARLVYAEVPSERSLARSEATSCSNTRRGNHTAYSNTP